jgi:AcrR family transcriptional regulator
MADEPARLTRAESQRRTREALLDAAETVFAERGFAGASVEAIAAAAGFTRGAFYSNFATKEELFAALLQERVYAVYRRMAEQLLERKARWSPADSGRQVAAVQPSGETTPMFRLWLEMLAQAGRDEDTRRLVAGFWSGNRALMAELAARNPRRPPGLTPEQMASAFIAMDVGLALQHFADPEAVPLETWPAVWETIFGGL